MPSDEKPLTRYSECEFGGMEFDDEGTLCEYDEVGPLLAAKNARIVELEATIGKFYGWRPPASEETNERFWEVLKKREAEFQQDLAPAVNAYLREKLEAAEGTIRQLSKPPEEDLSDPPVTRRELAAILRAYAEDAPKDYWAMLERLERGERSDG